MTSHMGLVAAAIVLAAGTAEARDNLYIVGSSTVYPYTAAVVETFAASGRHPRPRLESTGTGGGLAAFCAGVGDEFPDITGASRAITLSEWSACLAAGVYDVTEMQIGYDGLTVATAKTSPHDFALTLRDLYTALAAEVPVDGKIVTNPHRTWADVRAELPAVAIEVVGPPASSGTRDSFVELAMHRGCMTFNEVRALKRTDESAWDRVCGTIRSDGPFRESGEDDEAIVAGLEANPDTLGIFGYSYLHRHGDTLRGVPVEGVVPDLLTIADREYPLSRPLFLYVKNQHRPLVPGLADFLEEYVGAVMPQSYLLHEVGLVPVLDETARETIAGVALDGVAMRQPER